MYATTLHCFFCGADFPLTNLGSCPICARSGQESALNETLGVKYDLAALKRLLDREELARRPAGLWRYRELLPVIDPAFRIDLGAGGTRLAPLTRLPEVAAGNLLYVKVEGSNPTGSFKDRPIGIAASLALEWGARGLACLTVQISAYGARIITPVGDLGQLYALADRIEAELGWSFMHNVQAYQSDGDKTTAFEICEQLGWQAPAAIFVPTGTGTNLFGIWQGFVLFKELGFIDIIPRMFAVQPTGAASLVTAWQAQQEVPALLEQIEPNLAPPISHRVSGYHAYKAILESNGGAVAVSDAEMLAAVKDLASYEGIYCEAASAAALAGIRRALTLGFLEAEEVSQRGIVGIRTSHGLKNSLAMSGLFPPPPQIEGTWEAVRAFLTS